MDFSLYELCMLRHMIAGQLEANKHQLKKYQRYARDLEVEDFYTRLSVLESERKTLHRIDEVISDCISELTILSEH